MRPQQVTRPGQAHTSPVRPPQPRPAHLGRSGDLQTNQARALAKGSSPVHSRGARASRPGSKVCPDGQRASYPESHGRRSGSARAGLLVLLQRAGRLPAGRLVHNLRLAAPGVQADSLCHEPGVDHRRGVRALLAVRSPARRGRRPVRPQASDAGQRHRPGVRDRRDPRPGDRRVAAGRGHLCRDLRAVDARDHLQLRGVRGHPLARRRAGTGHGQCPHHGGKQRRSDPRPRARRRARGFRACSRPSVRGRRLLSRLVGLPGPDPLQLQRRHAGQAPRRLSDPGPARRRAGGLGLCVVQPGTALHLDHDGPDQLRRHDSRLPARPLCPARPVRHQLRDRLPLCRRCRRHRRGQSRCRADPQAFLLRRHRPRRPRPRRVDHDRHGPRGLLRSRSGPVGGVIWLRSVV